MKSFNGYRSWNGWNISLWINNDEHAYFYALDLVKQHGRRTATVIMNHELNGSRTPDGATYNFISIYNALNEIED